ncbi:MAG: serine/threonine-protein kinase [Verrucomicrobiales bacterium]
MNADDIAISPQPDWRGLAHAMLKERGAAAALPEGTALRYFGDYLLEEEIARGGMGIVYRAVQLPLGRTVAVKVLRDGAFAGGSEVERFRREASSAAALRHRNIVGIHEIGEHEGAHFFSMDYVAGPTLGQLLRDGSLPARNAAALMVKIAQAIHHAHAAGVLHRDLKPSNVLMDTEGEPMVTDFGLARLDAAEMGLTLSGQVLGTPAYMAPEQAEGLSKEAGPPTDVYGLGALFYHMLTGRMPFTGDSHMAVLKQVTNDEPVSAVLLNPSVPRDVETVCAKAMSKDPARRYASALALAEDLKRFLDGKPVLARPVSPAGKLWRWARRHRALAASLAGVALSLLAVAVVSAVSARRLKSSRDDEKAARVLADENAWRAELNLYAADMKTAWQQYQEGALDAMIRRLREHTPAPGARDPRGVEWYLLDRLSQGDQTATFPLPRPVEEAAFTSDAQWCVVAGGGTARLLDARLQKEALSWPETAAGGHRQLLTVPDTKQFVMSSAGGLRLLDAEKGTVHVLHEEPCDALAFSRDGARLAAGNRIAAREEDPARHRVRIFKTADWSVERELPMFCRGLAWDAQGRLIVCDTPKGSPGRLTWVDPAQEAPVRQFALNPGHSTVQAAWLNTVADRFLCQLGNQENIFGTMSTGNIFLRRPGFSMEQACMEENGNRLIFAGQDQALRLWSTIDGEYGPSRRGHTDRVLAVAFTPGAQGMRSIAVDGTLREWDLRSDWQASVSGFRSADALTGAPLLSPDGAHAALCSGTHATRQDDAFSLHDLHGGKARGRYYASPLAWSPDGAWILALRRAKVLLINPAQSREHTLLELPAAPQPWLPRVSPDWKWLVWSPDGAQLKITELPGGRTLTELPCANAAPAFSPDGTRLAVPGADGMVFVSLPGGEVTRSAIPAASLAAWSPDGALIAVRDGTGVRVHEAASGALRHELSGHRAPVCGMAWSPDARTLATGCEDNTVHFWNLATSRDALVLPLHTPPVLMAFARDGSALIAGGRRGYRILETTLRLEPAAVPSVALAFPDPTTCAPAEIPAPPPDPASDDEVIKRRLRTLWEAAHTYRRQNNRWPDHLSHLRDLLPEPLDRALKSPEAERGTFLYQNDYTDPAYPSPFHYEWCSVVCDPTMGDKDLSWKTDGPVTQREYAERARATYGDKVPFIRLFGTHEEGKLPAILYDGTLAHLPDNWEQAYQSGWRPPEWN